MPESDSNSPYPQEASEEDYAPSGTDELLLSLASALRTKRSREAIASLIETYTSEIPIEAKRRQSRVCWSYAFTLAVIIGVGALGWLRIITSETAGTLLGAVIGAIFYGRRSNS